MNAYGKRSQWKRSVIVWLLSVATAAGLGAMQGGAAPGENRAELSPSVRAAIARAVMGEATRQGTVQTELLQRMVTERLASLRKRNGARQLTEVVPLLVVEVACELEVLSQLEDSQQPGNGRTGARSAGAETSSIPSSERQALIDLYNSTNGPGWSHSENWLGPAGTECTWQGVTCDATGTSVTQLSFNRNNMQGPLPGSLENLINLRFMIVYENPLTGQIPSELGSLNKLQTLSLLYTKLEGSIPPELGNLHNLQTLNLAAADLTGPVPPELANLTNLKGLYLGFNELTGPVPRKLADLPELEYLDLTSNQLIGQIPPELGNLGTLKGLWLGYNNLSGSIPIELTRLAKLQHLDLRSDHLTGPIPHEIGNLTNLQLLGLSFNQLTGSVPHEIGNLSNLAFLSLGPNHLTGPIPPEIGDLGDLLYLELPSCQLTGQLPARLINLTKLLNDHLDLRWNGLSSSYRALVDLLNSKQIDGDWQSTQTVPVTDLAVAGSTKSTVSLTWTPIAYQDDGGGYEVFVGPPGGPYASTGWTTGKSAEGFTVTDLNPGTEYCFVVRSFTPPHADNENTVVSDPSLQVCATTATTLEITTHSPLHSGNVGTSYSVTFTATCDHAPCGNWQVAGGALPPGLSLDPGTGVLAGTPTAEGRYTFVVQVGNSVGNSASKAFVLTILAAGVNPIPTLGGGGLALLALLLAAAGAIALRLRAPAV